MFVQVIRGQATDAGSLKTLMDRWVQELAPSAPGWLGSTAGVSETGEFFATARFASEAEARQNSDRQEQGAWWKEASQHFTGEPTFQDSTEVDVDLRGDPDRAGFVQVINGRSSDPQKVRELMNQNGDEFAAFRPDVLGSVGIGHEDGAYTVVIYFSSEAEAREGEKKEPPPAIAEQMAAMNALEVGEPSFLDLKDPWLYSAR
jgi:hypothetical protein